MKETNKGYSFLELLAYIVIISTLAVTAQLHVKKLLRTHQKSIVSREIHTATRRMITMSRSTDQDSSIFLNISHDKSYLSFKLKDLLIQKIHLHAHIITHITLKSGSLFKDHIFIDHNGFVSPSSLHIKFYDNSNLLITISRYGHISSVWN